MKIVGCDCYWCKQRCCYLCYCLDKHYPLKFPPGRSISRCQDCGEEYCDACFHRKEHNLCHPDCEKQEEIQIPLPLKTIMWNLDREDDPMCLSAEYYLKQAIDLAHKMYDLKNDEDGRASYLNEFLETFRV